MKHYRILEKKIANDITNGVGKKEYTIQYLKNLFFGLFYWKKVNKTVYYKYEEAFNEVKQLIVQSEYDNLEFGYHYIDAYKLFKTPTKTIPTSISTTIPKPISTPLPTQTPLSPTKSAAMTEQVESVETKYGRKATFVPKTEENKPNKSAFIPKNK